MSNTTKYIGIDLGGTKISCGIVNQTGEILIKHKIPTFAHRKSSEIINDIIGLIHHVLEDSNTNINEIKSIGYW